MNTENLTNITQKTYKIEFIPIYTVGFQVYDVPDEIMESLRSETQEMIESKFQESKPYNDKLAGNLEKEFVISKSYKLLDDYLAFAAPLYWKYYKAEDLASKKHSIKINNGTPDVWVNFQKKGEVNPLHNHGGMLSFVIYVKVPYTLKEEHSMASVASSNSPATGCLQFAFVDQYNNGGISTYNLSTDKAFENKMIVFPAGLRHIVYPFYTSDEYRITVAGNVVYEDS